MNVLTAAAFGDEASFLHGATLLVDGGALSTLAPPREEAVRV